MRLQERLDVRAEEPGPDGPLVVGGVPLGRSSLVPAAVAGVQRRERPQADRGQEVLLDDGEGAESEVEGTIEW